MDERAGSVFGDPTRRGSQWIRFRYKVAKVKWKNTKRIGRAFVALVSIQAVMCIAFGLVCIAQSASCPPVRALDISFLAINVFFVYVSADAVLNCNTFQIMVSILSSCLSLALTILHIVKRRDFGESCSSMSLVPLTLTISTVIVIAVTLLGMIIVAPMLARTFDWTVLLRAGMNPRLRGLHSAFFSHFA
jgi:amino acid transporter